jgi:RimJ/RimL family protein N-acetyltransferase
VGGAGINQINRANSLGNIGYWIGVPFRGHGYAATVALMAADFAFSELGLTRVEIVVLLENAASQRVAENTGATHEGLARNRLYTRGKPADALVYSLIQQKLLEMKVCVNSPDFTLINQGGQRIFLHEHRNLPTLACH